MTKIRFIGAPMLLMAALSCTTGGSEPTEPVQQRTESGSLAITNVNVIPMDRDRVIEDQTVIIRNGRIAVIAPSREIIVGEGTQTIDARGKYMLPGLIDMHVHIWAADLDDYVLNGVTSVRNMWGFNELPAMIRDVDAGRRLGPRIFSLTAGFDGSPPFWPQTQLSDDVTLIPAMLDRQVEMGFREIKMYQQLSLAAYDTLVALARRRNLTFAGHAPTRVPLRHVIESGQRSIEHMGGFRTSSQPADDARFAAQHGTYVCPTLKVQSILNGGNGDAARANLLKVFYDNNVKLLVGTDSGIDATQAGVSIHDELDEMVDAGMSRFAALRGATSLAAEYLGETQNIGTVEVGREADLLIVSGNPLRSISATRQIEAVIMNGVKVR